MTKSFKDKRIVERPEDEWIVISNTHEPLVSESDFETVKQRISVKQPCIRENPENIFRGLIYCSGCNTRLSFQHRVDNHKSKGCYRCARHIRYGKGECSSHYITIEQVKAVVLNDIRRHVRLASESAEKYADYLKGMFMDAETLDSQPFCHGLFQPQTVVSYPISPKLLIVMYHPNYYFGELKNYDRKITLINSQSDLKLINIYNQKQYEQSYNWTFSKSSFVLENLLNKNKGV